jgi:hypothetical protein
MTVRVYQDADESGYDEYKTGISVTVSDEHLYVSGVGAIIIAVYSPRSWHHAKVLDE